MALGRLREASRALLRRPGLERAYRAIRPPRYPGLRLTWRRFLNYHLARFERARGHTKVRAYPPHLTIEATNACNLRCPYCFTGAGEVGRERSVLAMPLYEKVLDELGPYLLYIDFCNWGEPLLNKNLSAMIRMAADRGVSTSFSTNFSIPFDELKAEALVESGLGALGVSLDGARQETYEQYRVRGDIETVLRNARLMRDAKRKLGSSLPRLIWEFHVFEWNKDDIEQARSIAEELDMTLAVSKGWVAGEEWSSEGQFNFGLAQAFFEGLEPERCKYPWTHGVINNDGAVAPCCGTFYREDDFGSVAGARFRDVWNNDHFQRARKLFHPGQTSNGAKDLVCVGCPVTLVWHDYQRHRAAGKSERDFVPRFTVNDSFNYFFNRRPKRNGDAPAGEVIGLEPVSAPKGD